MVLHGLAKSSSNEFIQQRTDSDIGTIYAIICSKCTTFEEAVLSVKGNKYCLLSILENTAYVTCHNQLKQL